MSSLGDLKEKLAEITYLGQAAGLLGWDQQTYMPPGAAESRALQESALRRVIHEMAISDELGRLLDGAERETAVMDDTELDRQLVRMARYDYERSRKLPPTFVAEDTETASMAQCIWADARRTNDYALFAPWLKKNIDIARRKVEYLGYREHPYDALLDLFEPKFTTREVQELFDQVRPVVQRILRSARAADARIDKSILFRQYPEAKQEAFGRRVVADFGYDFRRGRIDRTVHPFASSFSKDDCRITTRYDEKFLPMALMGTMHEAGHAMYEQNTGDDLRGTPLAEGCSNSVHESQSRLWENLVGRSRSFWSRYFQPLQETFPDALGGSTLDELYRALNVVEPSLIRVEADEVTYNLHIMLRFELEQALLTGSLTVADAPDAWAAKMQEYLGVAPTTNSEGVMQDIHWSFGGMGYFPTYSLGNFLSAQLFEQIRKDIPGIDDRIAGGDFSGLFGWLSEHVWRWGRRFFPQELIEKATGARLGTGPYIAYLERKFGDIYKL